MAGIQSYEHLVQECDGYSAKIQQLKQQCEERKAENQRLKQNLQSGESEEQGKKCCLPLFILKRAQYPTQTLCHDMPRLVIFLMCCALHSSCLCAALFDCRFVHPPLLNQHFFSHVIPSSLVVSMRSLPFLSLSSCCSRVHMAVSSLLVVRSFAVFQSLNPPDQMAC